jgi:hypothetical protein
MNIRLQTAVALAAIGLSAFTFIPGARACDIGGMGDMQQQPAGGDWAVAAPKHHGAGNLNLLQRREPITGLYQFTVTAKGSDGIPDGTMLDHGFVTWHADGTEIMNSSRAPMTQSFCMGAWARTGTHTYVLNHYAMSWDDAGKVFVGPANIREKIRLAEDGNSYSGSFSLKQYAADGVKVLMHVQGTVAATRITADPD